MYPSFPSKISSDGSPTAYQSILSFIKFEKKFGHETYFMKNEPVVRGQSQNIVSWYFWVPIIRAEVVR